MTGTKSKLLVWFILKLFSNHLFTKDWGMWCPYIQVAFHWTLAGHSGHNFLRTLPHCLSSALDVSLTKESQCPCHHSSLGCLSHGLLLTTALASINQKMSEKKSQNIKFMSATEYFYQCHSLFKCDEFSVTDKVPIFGSAYLGREVCIKCSWI